MKQIDFIHKYKNSLPTNLRSQFERDLLSVFIDDQVTRKVLENEIKKIKSGEQKDYFQQIMDIETNKLKDE